MENRASDKTLFVRPDSHERNLPPSGAEHYVADCERCLDEKRVALGAAGPQVVETFLDRQERRELYRLRV